jgi:hypothetical protein
LTALRYDLSKLRAKGLVEKLPRSRRYRLPAPGYSVCLIFLKLFDRVYAPLTAGLLQPVAGDAALLHHKRSPLDRLYQRCPLTRRRCSPVRAGFGRAIVSCL